MIQQLAWGLGFMVFDAPREPIILRILLGGPGHPHPWTLLDPRPQVLTKLTISHFLQSDFVDMKEVVGDLAAFMRDVVAGK